MYIGKFLVLEGVYTYLEINYFSDPIDSVLRNKIDSYFKNKVDYDYGFTLEYIGEGVYGVTNGDVFIAFDNHRIISNGELFDIAFNDRNNSNSVH